MVLSENPNIRSSRIILFVLWIFLCQRLNAQAGNEKSVFWQLGIGNTYLYDDYLSPLAHEGTSLLFASGCMKPLKWGLPDHTAVSFDEVKWFSQSGFAISPAYGKSTAGSTLFHGSIDLRKGLLRQMISSSTYHVAAGAYTALSGGGRYCLQNGNNPGSVDILTDLGITVFSDYKFTLWGKPMIVNYQGSLSVAGLAFSPDYAESYYEIFYLGNHHNIVKFTNPFNKQQWRQQLNLSIPLSHRKSSLRLSYWNEGRVSLFNNIRTRVISDHFSVGYISYFSIL